MATSLTGKKILVTRPKQQAANLSEQIQNLGGEAVLFPVLDIEYKADTLLENWSSDWHKIIFISQNAVTGFLNQVKKQQLSPSTQLVAVGAATAKCLDGNGLEVSITPKENGGSEYLLSMPEMQKLANEKILIVRGEGGRELLADMLKSRQAQVQYCEVYRRVKSTPSLEVCQQAALADILICTSAESVKNLVSLLATDKLQLIQKPLIVLSERIKQTAEALGFKQVVVTAETNDAAIIDALLQMEA